jgi:polysaccharide pyruvyl transferase WcaK-like protein
MEREKVYPKVLLIGARLCRNLGGPSLLVTTKRVLDQFLTNADYTLVSPTAEDLALAEIYNIKIAPGSLFRSLPTFFAKRITGISIGPKAIIKLVDVFVKADIVIDIWGIIFCDSLLNNRFSTRAIEGLHLALAKMFRKPVVKYTADIGPFESRWNKLFARFYIKHFVDLILARNEVTKQRLINLGVSIPVMVCPDTAFVLEPGKSSFAESLSREKAGHPIVGFSVSYQAAKQSRDPDIYLTNMAALADHIVNSISAKVVLIPNALSAEPLNDDAFVAREICRRMTKPNETFIFLEEYNAWEMKGIIGQCDVVVGSRYHSIVAALSQGIPVLAVGWHEKYPEVLRLVGQEKHLCLAKSLSLNDLREQFDSLWHDRHRIKNEINAVLPQIREKIFQGGKAVSLLINKAPAPRLSCRQDTKTIKRL